MTRTRALAAAWMLMLPNAAPAADAADATDAALDLADATPATPVATVRPWKLNLEAAVRASVSRDGTRSDRSQLALDFRLEHRFAPSVNARFAARFDRFDPLSSQAERHRGVGIVKEASLSWQATPQRVVDVGRVNERIGAATGYNPTDFFKAGAVGKDVPPDPESRRSNRLGTVVLRAQQLWDSGALSLLLSPRLTARREPGDPSASSDLQRTNGAERWLLSGSHKLGAALQPQWLVYAERGQSPQGGLNVSTLFGDAVVGYAEWAGGRSASLIARAAGRSDDRAFRSRWALGATWTLPIDLSLTVEAQANGAGASAAQWSSLAAGDPMAWGHALQSVVARQELPTRHGLFIRAVWRNAGVRRLDLSGFVQSDTGGGGRQSWLELRHRFDGFDLALQLQRQTGDAWSRFGAMREQRSVQLFGIFYY